jgi:phosphatidylserine/phosphatidylglycerophosphate/cardiolipin synthase-like enzyme
MQNAVAFANNDVLTVAWSYGGKLERCMGFALYRIDEKGKETPLPAFAVFPGFKLKKGDTCEDYPIQKFYWKDVYARLLAEKTGQRQFRYRVVPLEGPPGNLRPMNIPQAISNKVTITPRISPDLFAYFNRGLISTQRIARAFKGKPSAGGLLARIQNPKDALRASLSGDMVEALRDFVLRVKSGGRLYAAIYELHDPELVSLLEKVGKKLSIVLSNAMQDEQQPVGAPKKKVDGNQDARQRLTKTASVIHNRILGSNQIGHNKFVVHVDKSGKPRAVLFGSTNWTPTGLCAQTNNTIVLEDAKVATRYLDDWKQLAADTRQAQGDPKKLQGSKLRGWDATGRDIALAKDGALTSWFSPNTPRLRSSSKKGEKRPSDMSAVVKEIDAAEHAVLFLVFYPGSPNVAQWAAAAQRKDKNLFVRGCVTNPSASESFYYELKGMTPPKRKKGDKTPRKEDSRVVAAQALDPKSAPPGWTKELLSAGHAIVHDKIVVIDPFSDKCVVITGSHNLGYKASFNNDENVAIIRGNRKLSEAYASHVLDVYDHFAWRVMVKRLGAKAKSSLIVDPDEWQAKYFSDTGEITSAQQRFWLSAKT